MIEFLTEVLALETAMNSYTYYTGSSAISGKTIKLNDFYLKKFLDALGDRPFSSSYSAGKTVPLAVIRQ